MQSLNKYKERNLKLSEENQKLVEENQKLGRENLELRVERTDHAADLFFSKSEAEYLKLQVKSLNGELARLKARIAPSESREKSVGGRLSGFLNLTPQSCRKCSTKTAEAETQTCPSVQKEEGTQTSWVKVEAVTQTSDVQKDDADTQTLHVLVSTHSMETQTSEEEDKAGEDILVPMPRDASTPNIAAVPVSHDVPLPTPQVSPTSIAPSNSTTYSRGSVTDAVYSTSSDGSSAESTSDYSTNTPHLKRRTCRGFYHRNHDRGEYSQQRHNSTSWRNDRRPQSRGFQGSESNNWRKTGVKQKEEISSTMCAAIIQILQHVITAC